MILVDTNILLRAAQPGHSQHRAALQAVGALRLRDEILCLVPQVIYGYWVVASRPVDRNGLGMTVAEAEEDVAMLLTPFRFLRDERSVFEHWRELIRQHGVVGRGAHDTRLVAAMIRHRIPRILTFNTVDFARYSGISIVDPHAIATK